MEEEKATIIIETTANFKERAKERAKNMGFNLTNYIKILIAQDLEKVKKEQLENDNRAD